MWLFLLIFSVHSVFAGPCAPRIYDGADTNIVCVCNATYCDDIPQLPSFDENEAVVIQSTLSGLRFQLEIVKFRNISSSEAPSISVDARQIFQEIIGFGGAFTDAAGINIAALSSEVQKKLLESYFSSSGLEYTLGRVPIASTDFSTHEYSYDDVVEDLPLENFSLAKEDFDYKIPFIKSALKLSKGSLRLFSSPWSAPGWMKTTGRMKGPGALQDDPFIHKAYANYFVRFFEEYANHGIRFWGTTIQNEPTSGALPNYPWQTMLFTAYTQRDFVRDFLAPVLKREPLTKNLVIMALDDNRFMLPGWADVMFADATVSDAVEGIGIHWYGDLYTPATLLSTTHDRHPDKFILATEACAGWTGMQGPILGDWFRAEMYADSIITDLNHWVSGWTDWNLCLDETGGPNWVFNVVDAPVIVNKTANEFYKQPMFYAMGHFSKYMRPGAKRIFSEPSSDVDFLQIVATSLKGQRVLVILNRTSGEVKNLEISEKSRPGRGFSVAIPPHSITTVIWRKAKVF